MDDATLLLIADEIAALLREHLPDGQNVALRADSASMKSKSLRSGLRFQAGTGRDIFGECGATPSSSHSWQPEPEMYCSQIMYC